MLKKYLELGKVVSTHGVRGELRVQSWCDSPEFFNRFKQKQVYLGKNGADPYTMLGSRPHGNIVLVTLEGVKDLDAANALRGRIIYVKREDVELPEGRYFVAELKGCTVSDADTGVVYGKVTDVSNTGATDIWTVKGENGTEYLMPIIPGILVSTDVEQEQITVRPIPGIFNDAEEIRED